MQTLFQKFIEKPAVHVGGDESRKLVRIGERGNDVGAEIVFEGYQLLDTRRVGFAQARKRFLHARQRR